MLNPHLGAMTPNDECLVDYNAENSFLGRKPEDIKFCVGDIVWASSIMN